MKTLKGAIVTDKNQIFKPRKTIPLSELGIPGLTLTISQEAIEEGKRLERERIAAVMDPKIRYMVWD